MVHVHRIEGSVETPELRQVAAGGNVREHRPLQLRSPADGAQCVDRLSRDWLLEAVAVLRGPDPIDEEGVPPALLHCGPLAWVLVEHECEKRRQLLAAAPMAAELVEARLLCEGRLPDRGVAKAGDALLPAGEELEDDHAKRMHVPFRGPEPSQPDLRRHVSCSAARGAAGHEVVGKAEVDDHRRRLPPIVVRGNHDIALLEVTMRDIPAMQVCDALQHLIKDLGEVHA
mmetsp:Transcript_56619/g.165581  ORF Transcript_56619/g.165581 Transcript_56619/m.165581 type:complete len:229 (+) Transcript_56619:541-1227(+)